MQRHMNIGRKDSDKQQDQPASSSTAQPRYEHAKTTRNFSGTTDDV